ncbi:LOW QUALITY PROTEIN: hemicentin-1-like, partial [Acropora millepora]|uniref:LOW QUALITY PROTEIN: hemicentin-1-like n=1 Tax=Acropora millepora TaxID=45264 RepID=UPI001CF30FE8
TSQTFTTHPQNKTVREGDPVTLFCNATGNPKPSISLDQLMDKPAFTTHPQNKTVREGDPVTLFCNATGNPKPSISWTIDGLPVNITVHSRISLTADNKQLTVKDVNRTDSHHKYRCLARNSIGTITSYAASLTIQYKPTFTTHPQNKTVREGDPVTLFCNATGNPKPSISWTIDGLPVNITVHSRISVTADNKQLTVKNVNRTDSHHKYRCLARNSIGTITSYAASLTIQYKPAIATYPRSQTVREGNSVTLFCNATGNPKPSISWTIDWSTVNFEVHSRVSLGPHNKQLTVKNVNRTDSNHQYRCLANNSVENITSDAVSLNVQYKPAFATHPRSQTVREGDNVTLSCHATGNPKPTISWTIDGSTVNIKVHPRVSLGPDNKQLTVRNVKRTDSNHQYRCLANNSVETITSDAASLNVQYKPAFTTHPQNKTVREGDPVTLFCNATGNPKPSISWTIDGLPVNITVHSRISLTADNKQLTVKDVNRTDSHHKYRCLARNSIGTITSYAASLTIQYKPTFTTHPQNKTVREGDPVTLFCNATGNPKPSISWTIDGLPVNITVHSRISVTADNKQLTVKNVNRTDSHHKYRCLARNSIGTITSYAASLTIQYKPAIATYPRSQTVREGNSVTLFCNATGNPKPSISWTIDWSTVNFEVHSRVSLGPHNKQLTVKNVNRTDSNHQYRCLANNSVETITSDAVSLNVQYKPAFATHPRSQAVREGDNVTLSCHATGNPKPTISWTIDGSTVNIKVHPRVSLGPDNKQLTVRNVKRTDSNHQYRCLANNSVETITSDAASLNVQYKPAFTTHPQNKTVREGDPVTLFCNATGNPKPSISWTIDGLPVNITVHSRISLTADNKQLTVKDVNRTDSHHKYRCLARNSIGTITSYAASLTIQYKPTFTTHPQNKTVREGDPVTLFCNATGNPKPSISWTIDGLPVNITVHSRISVTADNKQLTVKNVNRTDSHHKYRCLARNSIGTITSYAASLTIQYKPAIATYPRSQTVREGNSVTLFCNATGNPKPSISWTIDWSTVNFEVHSRVSLGPHNKQLTVKNVNRTDSNHQYRCLANNSVETITSDAVSLNVQYKPAFATHPRSQTVREGDNVTLSCHATGNPKPTISWTIDGSTVNIKVHPRVSLGPDNKQLTVRNVKRTDSNHQYRCLANNSVETITSDAASLNVQCEYHITMIMF